MAYHAASFRKLVADYHKKEQKHHVKFVSLGLISVIDMKKPLHKEFLCFQFNSYHRFFSYDSKTMSLQAQKN